MVSHAAHSNSSKHACLPRLIPPLVFASLLRNPIIRIKAIRELLAMLIRRMVRQHLLARGTLEGLEAGFALDGLCGGVLITEGKLSCLRSWEGEIGARKRTALSWDLASLGPLSPLRSRFCCALVGVLASGCNPRLWGWRGTYLAPLPMVLMCEWLSCQWTGW